VKLLRVLEEREVWPVGATRPVPADVRIIASTNRDLAREVAAGRFREDLFYRLNVVRVHVPPLRERRGDIPLLIDHLVRRLNAKLGTRFLGVEREALLVLTEQPWRGNVRELENVIQRAVFLCTGDAVDRTDLMVDSIGSAPPANGKLRDMERDMILKTLKEVNGNKSQAAKVLGVSVRTVRNKLNEYGQKLPVG
jgi:two-component system response regulator FlrC